MIFSTICLPLMVGVFLRLGPGDKLPLCGLPPARIIPDLCLLHYRISTSSPQCQAYFDQGLGYLYSYVWMEAARSFETAARYDADCAMAWWGLSRALERRDRNNPPKATPKTAQPTTRASPGSIPS